MLKGLGARSAMLAAVAAAAVSSARADSEQTAQAVIRGTGTDVTLVYRAPKSPSFKSATAIPSDPVGGALRMKTAGADDLSVVAFLRRNQADLPDVIDASVVKELRKAGAGEPVITFLSERVALDIGVTAEDTNTRGPRPPGEAAPFGGYPDLVEAGYPFYGGGGYGGYGGYGRSFRRLGRPFGHPGFTLRSQAFPFFRPSAPKTNPSPMHPPPMPRPRPH